MTRRIALLLLFALAGCSPRRDVTENRPAARQAALLGEAEEEHIVLVAIDLGPTFRPRVVDGGAQFVMRVIEKYFRSHAGSSDKLVLAQLSGDGDRSLLWEGTPLALRKQFPTPDAFRDFLVGKADKSPSQVYKGLRHATQYVLSNPRVQESSAKVAVFVVSDMLDPARNDKDDRELGYLSHLLNQIGWRNGAIAFYYVDQSEVLPWRQRLQWLGVRNYRVESEIVGSPPIPGAE
jgi:hypothetical protein